jgi:hypothetical protein
MTDNVWVIVEGESTTTLKGKVKVMNTNGEVLEEYILDEAAPVVRELSVSQLLPNDPNMPKNIELRINLALQQNSP